MDIYQIRQQLKTCSIFDIPLRVAFYARVSTDSDEQLNSLENQTSYYHNFINSNPNWTLVEGYIDEGLSAATTRKRENFNLMIEDAKLGKFDFIITKELTRFARNTLDSIKFTRELLSYGVCVLFQGDNINTIDEDSELRLTIMAGIAQDELRKLSSRIKFGHQQAIKNGVVLGNSNIFGYRKSNKKLVVDEEEAVMVRELFEMYATGQYSLRQMEIYFYEKGYRNRKGNKIKHNTLSGILSNPKYKGYYVGNKVKVVDLFTKKQKFLPPEEWVLYKDETGEIVPAIVSEEIWDMANEVLQKRSLEVKTKKLKCNHPNLLTGKLRCTHCDAPYYRKDAKYKNHVTSRWVCSGKLNNGAHSCQSFAILEDEMQKLLFDIFTETYQDADKYIDDFLEFYRSTIQNGSYRNIEELQRKIDSIQAKKEKLLSYNVDGKISDDDFLKMYNKCELELSEYNKQLIECQEEDSAFSKVEKEMKSIKRHLKEAVKDISNNATINAAFVNKYIKQILVTPIDKNSAKLEIQLFSNEILQKNLVRIGQTSKKISPIRTRNFIRDNRRDYGHQTTFTYDVSIVV